MRTSAPSKDEIAALPAFEGLPLARVVVPATAAEFAAARDAIRAAGVVGFDTESKPLFDVGAVSTGPHVVQFATEREAFIFQVSRTAGLPFLLELFAATDVTKVGFGLSSDLKHIHTRFGVALEAVTDLNTVFRALGFRASTGVRAAVAILFERRLQKSKRQTTSNWALPTLDAKQLLYAANDAYAALRVHLELERVLAARAAAGGPVTIEP
jgi:ribonuclease D